MMQDQLEAAKIQASPHTHLGFFFSWVNEPNHLEIHIH